MNEYEKFGMVGEFVNKHPVSKVIWVPIEMIVGNDYNPNKVAGPEFELLELSIQEDGYTQPIVTWWNDDKGVFEVVDGFHRHLIGRKLGYEWLPVVVIDKARSNRMASTVRHNRARGKHTVDRMSDIVLDLSRRRWDDKKIGKELGMDDDEVLRLKQITGLAELFAEEDFSEAWE